MDGNEIDRTPPNRYNILAVNYKKLKKTFATHFKYCATTINADCRTFAVALRKFKEVDYSFDFSIDLLLRFIILHSLIRTMDDGQSKPRREPTRRRDTRARHATLPTRPTPRHARHRSATLQPYSYTSKQAAMNSSTGKSGKSGDTPPSAWYGNLVSWIRNKEAIFMMLLIWRSSMNRLVASRQRPTSLLNRCSSGSRPS